MIKFGRIFILLGLFVVSICGKALGNQMTGFEIRNCAGGSCFLATGKQGFVSVAQDTLSANNVRLEIFKKNQLKGQQVSCASLNYDLVTQLLICDNREVGQASLTINSRLVVQKISSL